MIYHNGNAIIAIGHDGTRTVEFDSELKLEWPLNIDIRVSSQCAFGYNPKTQSAVCSFCHESARTDGKECDYSKLKEKLDGLPKGVELAIGCNQLTPNLQEFLTWCKEKQYIANLTVNQGHIRRDAEALKSCIAAGTINGLGVSFRGRLKWDIPDFVLSYQHTVFHVIAGIDNFDDVFGLKDRGVKKILVLGEKDFGFNQGKVDLSSRFHLQWFWYIRKLFDIFDVVSFDNLGIEQLDIQRFLTTEQWQEFYQGEHSMYIDAIGQFFSPSSRDHHRVDWNSISLQQFFIGKE